MAFERANPLGWVTEPLTAAQINHIDLNQSRALDGTGGGTYSPTTALTIAGLGLAITGALSASNITSATLGPTGTFTAPSGSTVTFDSGSTLTVNTLQAVFTQGLAVTGATADLALRIPLDLGTESDRTRPHVPEHLGAHRSVATASGFLPERSTHG